MYVSTGTMQHIRIKKKRIEHAHNLETVVERGSVHIETNKHIPYVFISCQTTNKKLQKKMKEAFFFSYVYIN